LHAIRALGRPLGVLAEPATLYPQVLVNVKVARKFDFSANALVTNALQDAENSLAGNGRVLLRASGTEPVIRVMVEGADDTQIRSLATKLADTVAEAALLGD